MKKSVFYLLSTLFVLTALAACSEHTNDEKYRSEPPLFSDFSIKSLSTGTSEVHVGDRFVVTAEQSKLGRLIYKSQYTWTNSANFSQKYKQSAIYDDDNVNPTDTMVASASGDVKVTLNAKYYTSGNVSVWSSKYGSTYDQTFNDGKGSATYTVSGLQYFTVEAHKTFTILP